MGTTWYLKDEDGVVVAMFCMEDDFPGFTGKAFTCDEWDDDKRPYRYLFHSNVLCKPDGNTDWWFEGEDVDPGRNPSHYNLYTESDIREFMIIMAFVWNVARMYWVDEMKNEEAKEAYKSEFLDRLLIGYGIYTNKLKRKEN